MPLYVKLSVDYQDDEKILSVSPMAELLYVRSLAFAKRLATEGTVRHRQVSRISDGLGDREPLIKELVAVGLWEEFDDGYAIAAWQSWNETSDEIEEKRRQTAERVARFRVTKSNKSCNAVTENSVTQCNLNNTATTTDPTPKTNNTSAASPPAVLFPPSMDTPECRAALDRWIAYRAERKPKLTQSTIAAIPKTWDARGPTRFIAAVDYSISQGWQGIYEEKSDGNTQREQANGARIRAEPGKYAGLKIRGSVPGNAATAARDPPGQVHDSRGVNAPNAEPLAGSG